MAKGRSYVHVASDVAAGLDDARDPSRAAHVVAHVGNDEHVFLLSRAGLQRLHRQIGRALDEPPTAGRRATPKPASGRSK